MESTVTPQGTVSKDVYIVYLYTINIEVPICMNANGYLNFISVYIEHIHPSSSSPHKHTHMHTHGFTHLCIHSHVQYGSNGPANGLWDYGKHYFSCEADWRK